jgi:DNA-binding transcriptional LysR family regulator
MVKGQIMEYRYLNAFLAVGKSLNFTVAAKELYITQSAISRQIRLLEDDLGYQLVIRSPQSVTLTENGQKLFRHCFGFDEWIREFHKEESNYILKIGVYQGFLENCLVDIISKHYGDRDLNLQITLIGPRDAEQMLMDNEIDIAIAGKNIQNENLTSLKILDEKIILISKKKVSIKSLHESPWIICDKRDYIVNYSKKQSSKKILIKSVKAQLDLVDKGIGIAMMPDYLIPSHYKLKKQVVEKFSKEHVYLTTHNYRIMPRPIKHFLEIIKSEL